MNQGAVWNTIQEFLQVEINAPAVAFGDILLRLCHRLMSRPSRPKTVAVLRERPIALPLQNLHHRLLDKAIQHRGNAKLSHSSVRLGDFHPPYRLRFVSSVQQLFSDRWPVLFQVVRELPDSHPVDSGTTFIGLYLPQCFLQIVLLTYFLHQSTR